MIVRAANFVARETAGAVLDHAIPFRGAVKAGFRVVGAVRTHGVSRPAAVEVGQVLGEYGGKKAGGLGAAAAATGATPIAQVAAGMVGDAVGGKAGHWVGGHAAGTAWDLGVSMSNVVRRSFGGEAAR